MTDMEFIKVNLKAKKERWSSDKVVVIRRRPKPMPTKDEIRRRIFELLPEKKPYVIGIHHAVFEILKKEFPQFSLRKLRTVMSAYIYYTCNSYTYLQEEITSPWRYGLNGEKTPMEKTGRKYARMTAHEHRVERDKLAKKIREMKKKKKKRALQAKRKK